MRTVLAAAAAGALVMGSASGAAMAKGKPDTSTMKGVMKVRMVNIHNGTFDLKSPASVRAKVNVWDSVKKMEPTSVTVTLAEYTAKGGEMVLDGLTVTSPTMSTKAGMDKKSKNYYGAIDLGALASKVTAVPVILCLSKVTLEVPTDVTLGGQRSQVTKKIGRDCITVVNTTPIP